ncbi:hypothetical protein BWR18_05665 [Tateyamaria omphalii]|uniref:Uncharacterized protein n=1 Tax=Tateyamaria omphalii TaxID=299262 RepID=A0A1P8MT23_9RHOB|nr:hypothetical protein BWR18_05665 [Tateyamaria omphalii]
MGGRLAFDAQSAAAKMAVVPVYCADRVFAGSGGPCAGEANVDVIAMCTPPQSWLSRDLFNSNSVAFGWCGRLGGIRTSV